jgi:hypothetical protein
MNVTDIVKSVAAFKQREIEAKAYWRIIDFAERAFNPKSLFSSKIIDYGNPMSPYYSGLSQHIAKIREEEFANEEAIKHTNADIIAAKLITNQFNSEDNGR